MGHGRALAIAAALVVGCVAPEQAQPNAASIDAAPVLIAIGPAQAGPEGSDAVPSRRVGFRMPDGSIREVDREAIALVPRWRGAAALVDPERRLYEVRPDGHRRMLASGASGALAVSDDGALLAYVIARDVYGELRVHDGERESTIASGLASIGALRVLGDRVLFVGGQPGGVAGVWIARIDHERDPASARCVTNCDLVTGTDWQDRFVPPPASASTFELGTDTIAWTDADGARHEAAREDGP
jgi:hypothetical protein